MVMLIPDDFKHIEIVAAAAHDNALQHGFYDDIEDTLQFLNAQDKAKEAADSKRNFILAQLSKVGCEVGEAVEAIQKHEDYSGVGEELADIMIRTMDLARYMGLHIGDEIFRKMKKNITRPYKHGKIC